MFGPAFTAFVATPDTQTYLLCVYTGRFDKHVQDPCVEKIPVKVNKVQFFSFTSLFSTTSPKTNKNELIKPVTTQLIQRVVKHPNFLDDGNKHDIALIELDWPSFYSPIAVNSDPELDAEGNLAVIR